MSPGNHQCVSFGDWISVLNGDNRIKLLNDSALDVLVAEFTVGNRIWRHFITKIRVVLIPFLLVALGAEGLEILVDIFPTLGSGKDVIHIQRAFLLGGTAIGTPTVRLLQDTVSKPVETIRPSRNRLKADN